MSVRNSVIIGVLWLSSLAAVAATAGAQAPQPAPQPRVYVVPTPLPEVLTGDEIGFRLDSWQGKTPVGTLVIRVNGQWVEPMSTKKHVLITR